MQTLTRRDAASRRAEPQDGFRTPRRKRAVHCRADRTGAESDDRNSHPGLILMSCEVLRPLLNLKPVSSAVTWAKRSPCVQWGCAGIWALAQGDKEYTAVWWWNWSPEGASWLPKATPQTLVTGLWTHGPMFFAHRCSKLFDICGPRYPLPASSSNFPFQGSRQASLTCRAKPPPSAVWGQTRQKQTYRNKLTDTGNELMVAKWDRDWGSGWKRGRD